MREMNNCIPFFIVISCVYLFYCLCFYLWVVFNGVLDILCVCWDAAGLCFADFVASSVPDPAVFFRGPLIMRKIENLKICHFLVGENNV